MLAAHIWSGISGDDHCTTCVLPLLLQELPWRRIDVSFQGARFGFAHNNIQVGQQQVLR
jgi:hypothetical protein